MPRESDRVAAVQDFYERYPYPRPVDDLEDYRRRWQDRDRRRADFHLFWPDKPYREDQTILVAGCGTSQAAKHALRWPSARVIGIDFSATSVRSTEDLHRKYDLSNLEVHQLPIERVGDCKRPSIRSCAPASCTISRILMRRFVRCATCSNRTARCTSWCMRRTGEPASTCCRSSAGGSASMPADRRDPGSHRRARSIAARHPLARLLREAPDFRQEAALADALLHPQDRAYSVPQLLEFINGGGLEFGRWVKQAPYSPLCGVMAGIPQAPGSQRFPRPSNTPLSSCFEGPCRATASSFIATIARAARNDQLLR